YCYAKVKQDELVTDYGKKFGIPYVIVRPGSVYGPGKEQITGRVGIGTFGVFLHLGGSNTIPLTYVDNCVDAIVLAGLKKGVEGAAKLDSKGAHGGGTPALFPKLQGERTGCLKSPSWDAARSQMLTRRRSRGSRDARSLGSVTRSR